MSAEQKLIDLECRYAELEHTVHELNAVVTEQARAIDTLATQVRKLKNVVETVAERQHDGGSMAPEIGSDAEMTGLLSPEGWDAPSSG